MGIIMIITDWRKPPQNLESDQNDLLKYSTLL